MAIVFTHPRFTEQLERLAALVEEKGGVYGDVFADVSALWSTLENYGHGIESEDGQAASHPIVTSRYRAFALRRTPQTNFTPYADKPPVLRIPYVWFDDTERRSEVAVLFAVGDKTDDGKLWYPKTVRNLEETLIPEWERRYPNQKAQVKRTR